MRGATDRHESPSGPMEPGRYSLQQQAYRDRLRALNATTDAGELRRAREAALRVLRSKIDPRWGGL